MHRQSRRIQRAERSECVSLVPAEQDPATISNAVQPFTSEDFRCARGNPNVPSEYATSRSALAKLNSLTKFGFRYSVQLHLPDGRAHNAGLASLMDLDVTLIQSGMRKLGIDTHTTRTINGWLNIPADVAEQVIQRHAATETVIVMARAAKHLGLRSLEAVVMPEFRGKNPDLVVIEHAADLQEIGFREVGPAPLADQGQLYDDGTVWRLDLDTIR